MALKGPVLTLFTCLLTTTGLLAQGKFVTTWNTYVGGPPGSESIRISARGVYNVDLGNDGTYDLDSKLGRAFGVSRTLQNFFRPHFQPYSLCHGTWNRIRGYPLFHSTMKIDSRSIVLYKYSDILWKQTTLLA